MLRISISVSLFISDSFSLLPIVFIGECRFSTGMKMVYLYPMTSWTAAVRAFRMLLPYELYLEASWHEIGKDSLQ
jgi:hypothetical protein